MPMKCPNCHGAGRTPISGHCRTCDGVGKLQDYTTITVPPDIKVVRVAAQRRRWKYRELLTLPTGDTQVGSWQHETAEPSSNGVTSLPFLLAGRTYEIFIGDTGEAEVMVYFHVPPFYRKRPGRVKREVTDANDS